MTLLVYWEKDSRHFIFYVFTLRFPAWAGSEAIQPSIQWLLWILSCKYSDQGLKLTIYIRCRISGEAELYLVLCCATAQGGPRLPHCWGCDASNQAVQNYALDYGHRDRPVFLHSLDRDNQPTNQRSNTGRRLARRANRRPSVCIAIPTLTASLAQ